MMPIHLNNSMKFSKLPRNS